MISQGKWEVGFKDRGMGHGDYGVIGPDGLIAELPLNENQKDNAEIIASAPKTKRDRDALYDALKYALMLINALVEAHKKTVDAVRETHPTETKLPYLEKPPVGTIEQALSQSDSEV